MGRSFCYDPILGISKILSDKETGSAQKDRNEKKHNPYAFDNSMHLLPSPGYADEQQNWHSDGYLQPSQKPIVPRHQSYWYRRY